MAYNETLANAIKFQSIWKPMPFFHLRPTRDSATILCTIPKPRIAMRGKQKISQTFVEEHYSDLLGITPDLEDELILARLKKLKFNEHTSAVKEEEKLIQAMFINYIYNDPNALVNCGYSNVKFIASELVYPIKSERKRIPDIIAESDESILLIEIKKSGDINPGDNEKQLMNYKKVYFEENRSNTIELLKNYPDHKLDKDKPVVPIYLLKTSNTLPSVAKEDAVILLYDVREGAITVNKI